MFWLFFIYLHQTLINKLNKNMTDKNVLETAISKLVGANMLLRKKISESTDKEKSQEWTKEIMKNESIILDYKYRLQYDK